MSLVEEFRRWVKVRPKVLGGLELGTYSQLGGGKVIETVSKTAQEFITTIQEKRPKIIPTVMEKIKTYEPGKLVKTFIPTTEGGVLEKPSPPPSPEVSILRRPK